LAQDFNHDGKDELLLAGNFYPVSPQQGRYSEDYGSIYKNQGKGNWAYVPNSTSGLYLEGQIKDLKPIEVNGSKWLIVGRNNDSVQVFSITDDFNPL